MSQKASIAVQKQKNPINETDVSAVICIKSSPKGSTAGRHGGRGSAMNTVSVQLLSKRYGTTLAVDNITFTIRPGQTVGLLGGNGAGKTTTISMLLGILVPTAGRIEILGHDMAPRPLRRTGADEFFLSLYRAAEPHYGAREPDASTPISTMSGTRRAASPNWRRSWPCMSFSIVRQGSCPPGRRPAWRSPSPSSTGPKCCSWTSRRQASTPIRAISCEAGWSATARARAARCSSPRTTWPRSSGSATMS